jgi:rod shape-determining protein MreD
MNLRKGLLFTLIVIAVVILQSTMLSGIQVRGVRPDIALLLLVFFSHVLGPMEGKLMGFLGGLVKDFLSLSPFGFHALIDTTIGHVFGFTKEKVYIDPVTLPVLLAVSATLLKALGSFLLFALFIPEKLGSYFGISMLIEIGLNAVSAPFLYALLRLVGLMKDRSHTIFK